MNAPVLPSATPLQLHRGDKGFARVAAAFFLGGFTTFSLLYCLQPLLPLLSRQFAVSPATAALALSVTTLAMAPTLVIAGSISESLGRKRIMVASIALSSLATLASAFAPNWPMLIAMRAATGVALSGLPAVAMAYLADEIAPPSLGFAMGLYISGSTIGGMFGRLTVAAIADHINWRVAIVSVALEGLAGAVYFLFALPRERTFVAQRFKLGALVGSLFGHFRDPGLRWLFAEGFLVMGAFVCSYNYLGFRLAAPPFSLSATAVGFVFLIYIVGAASSTMMGDLAARLGRRKVLWTASAIALVGVAATLPDNLIADLVGLALVTWGFFGAHSISASWVGLRATRGRGQATALYLFFYYLGSSVAGWGGGFFYQRWGWDGVAALVGALVLGALFAAWRLGQTPPPAGWPKR